ncbi:hypothetical protein BH747_10225 [Enterococcus villorum]|uniref:Right handed beta helix domain-containing protein n=1 Tax=Enterococcus villorum TaxID=112904 RepID=A0A1V8YMA8_9ENTE|nr:right-handed parallel beta-helix repeat-containing protein [Enterococcus villorum]OQO69274.1 hypothetical protein BH747_10225 [Enterococcus villorum]OQO73749.1 hypothetical protein BH744_08995 [Enterococcus villorum]
MKKILFLIGLVMFFFSNLNVFADDRPVMYISQNGKVGATGTVADPLNNIQEAVDRLKNQTNKENPGKIIIREGKYLLKDSLKLTKESSDLSIEAYPKEKVEISGEVTLDKNHFKKLKEVAGSQFSSKSRIQKDVQDKVLVYNLGAENIPIGSLNKNGFNWAQQPVQPELIVNGKRQTLAQWPNGNDYLDKSYLLAGIEKGNNADKLTGQEKINYDLAVKAGANEGDRPREWYFDKTDTPKSYEEMLALKAPIFYVANQELQQKMITWAPMTTENETQENQSERTDIDNQRIETEGWFSGYFENNYANDMVKIYSIDQQKQLIHTKYPSLQGVQDKRIQLKAINLLCELDEPGEYYIDRFKNHNVLYYLPKDDFIDTISLTSLDKPLLQIENSQRIQVKDITFSGGTNYGLTLKNATQCKIKDCVWTNFGLDAIRVGDNNQTITTDPSYATSGGGSNNRIENCVFHDLGGGGVYLSGGNTKTLVRGNNVVTNCEFYNISRLKTYTPAIYLEGVGNTASENSIHDAPHMVIQIMGNDMLVTKNKIKNTCTNASDMAPIYAGRSWNWLGNEISYNRIENVLGNGNYGIYLDDNFSGMKIKNNLFINILSNPIFSNKGYGQQIDGNIYLTNLPAVKYLSNHVSVNTRPIPNEKVLVYRYNDVLRLGDGTDYSNTQENIDLWYKHYQKDYPYLKQRYIPEANDPNQESDLNSIFVSSYQLLKHQIILGTGVSYSADQQFLTYQSTEFNSGFYQQQTPAEVGLNLETGQIQSDSILMTEKDYGADWVQQWNEGFKK